MAKNLIKILSVSVFLFGCATKSPAPVKAVRPKNDSVYTDKENVNTNQNSNTSQNSVVAPITTVPDRVPIESAVPYNPPVFATPAAPEVSSSAPDQKGIPRIGLIFSAGGAKAWGHIGVIKEIEKAKWPVKAVAGIEWGAAVAALYAHQLSANEVEWELSKVKELGELEQSSDALFGNYSVADLKVPFVCPSLNVAKQEAFLLNRGQLNKLLPFCLSAPPVSPVYKQSVAILDHISALAQHLRATGVRKIILINVLSETSKRPFAADSLSSENVLWVKAAIEATHRPAGVDEVIQINLDDYGIKDLDKRREIMAKAAELSYDQIKKLSTKYGL